MGNGLKVEVLRSRGEGPLEEYDVIYYTEKRQLGTRMWQNANRLREEERAALISRGELKSAARLAPKSTATSLTPTIVKPNADGTPKSLPATSLANGSFQKQYAPATAVAPALTLAEAARRSDSIANVKSAVESNTTVPVADSATIDQVFIPKVPQSVTKSVATPEMAIVKKDTIKAVAVPLAEVVVKTDTTVAENKTVSTPITKADVTIPVADTLQPDFVKPFYGQNSVSAPASSLVKSGQNAVDTTAVTFIAKDSSLTAQNPAATAVTPVKTATTNPNSSTVEILKIDPKTGLASAGTNAANAILQEQPIQTKSAELSKGEITGSKIKDSVSQAPANTNSQKLEIVLPAATDTTASQAVKQTEKPVTVLEKIVEPAAKPVIKNEPSEVIPAMADRPAKSSDYITTAEIEINGSWEKVTVVDKESEYLYKVHFEGKNASEDEWVAVSQIRSLDSVKKTAPIVATTNKIAKVNNADCSFSAPAPTVRNGDQFSDKLAKRKIYESFAYIKAKVPTKIGVSFINFKTEEPYVNTVSVSEKNGLEIRNKIAPAGALIYPVITTVRICEQAAGQTSTRVVNTKYSCFRNKEGAWVCSTR
jgi:hypothetical protein